MSLPTFSTQSELFSTASLCASLFAETDRYRLFGKLVYPHLASTRADLEACYCAGNGRTALEPVLLLGVSLLQYLEGMPDRQAVDMLHYHAGWNFALNRQLGDPVFHPTSLVNFRHRLQEHKQSALGFQTILEALGAAGLVSHQSRQRLDSTQMMGRVARMNRLDCVREAVRLALQELAEVTPLAERPSFWMGLWERYVESQVDYRAGSEVLGNKLGEAGRDVWPLLEWLKPPAQSKRALGAKVQLLGRVFREQFEVVGQATPMAKEKEPLLAAGGDAPAPVEPVAAPPGLAPPEGSPSDGRSAEAEAVPSAQSPLAIEGRPSAGTIQPKGKGQLSSDRVQNPHDPEATYAVKGRGDQKKEHVGFKVQVAETVTGSVLSPGEPTDNFLTGIVTQPGHESDEAGAEKMEQEQAAMGMEKPPVQYVDGAYVSAQKLVQAQAEGRELLGPAQPAPHKDGRFTVEDFQVHVEERAALCPAGKTNTQCSRLAEEATGKVSYRFEFSTQCHDCPLRGQCLGKDQRHRTLVVGEHHSALQARRLEQQTEAFKQQMKHRNAIEGTQSELVRAHGLRRARYRGLVKVKLQNYFIGAACNVKRWIRREVWKLHHAARAIATEAAAVPAN
jgi:transposase